MRRAVSASDFSERDTQLIDIAGLGLCRKLGRGEEGGDG